MRTLLEEKCKIKLSSVNKEREKTLLFGHFIFLCEFKKKIEILWVAWAVSFAFVNYSKLKPSLPDTVFLLKMLILSKASGGLGVVV